MFTGIEQENRPLNLEQVSLHDLLLRALKLNRQTAESRGIRLSCDSFHSFPPMLLDPQRLIEAISLLLRDAVAAAPLDSGVDLMLASRSERAELLIRWQGSPESGAATPPVAPLAENTIISHGGSLDLEAGDGEDRMLTISLPVIRPAMQMDDLDREMHQEETDRRIHILLAEDSLMNRKLAASLLEKKGHSVTQVANGRDAVSAFLRGSFELVLMDLQMPLMNGFDAAETIRRLDSGRGQRVPIVALTASDTGTSLQRCLDSGMDALLSKPFKSLDFDQLLEKLETEALAAHRARIASD